MNISLMNFAIMLLILIGLFTACGGIFDWKWFIGHWKSRLFVNMFGHRGARVFYILFGFTIAGIGFYWFIQRL